jgi:hypothetical protein
MLRGDFDGVTPPLCVRARATSPMANVFSRRQA